MKGLAKKTYFLLTTSASTSLFGTAFFDVVEEVEDAC